VRRAGYGDGVTSVPATPPRIVFVTGTDSGVGKTWVGCALARALVQSGHSVVAIKVVETGTDLNPSSNEDGVQLAAATGQRSPRHAIYRFRTPVAPAVAAELEGHPKLDFDTVVGEVERVARGSEITLVETAGGLLAPLAWDWNVVDLAEALGASVLVAAANRLGTINHTLLTLSALELGGILAAGVVLSAPEVPDVSMATNRDAIVRLSGLDRVLEVPRTSDPAQAATALAPALPWILPSR
jgi:dethiobiotin synthetase